MDRIAASFICEDLRPRQSDINLIIELGKLPNHISPQIYCQNIPKPPVSCVFPIFPLHYINNNRHDKIPMVCFINSWRLINVQLNIKKFLWVDCPEFLYPLERHNFINILSAYRSPIEIITSCHKYQLLLRNLGCMVSNTIICDYNSELIAKFIEEQYAR